VVAFLVSVSVSVSVSASVSVSVSASVSVSVSVLASVKVTQAPFFHLCFILLNSKAYAKKISSSIRTGHAFRHALRTHALARSSSLGLHRVV